MAGVSLMIIDLKTNFVYKCPECFAFYAKKLNVFEILPASGIEIKCRCGQSSASIHRNNNIYTITVPCFICGDEHKYKLSYKRFWKSDFVAQSCFLSNLDVCAVGDDKYMKKWINEYSTMLDTIMENDFE